MAIVAGGAIGAVGTGAYVVVAGGGFPTETAADALADSTHVADSVVETVAGESTRGDDSTTSGGSSQPAGGDPETTAGGGEPATTPAPAPVPAGGATPIPLAPINADSVAQAAANYQRLARIFAAMKPDEAAPVLAKLDDAQLEGILLAMQGRNAAPILAEMDPERAASLSRRVLRGNQ